MKPPHPSKSTEYKHLRAQAALPGRGGIARIWAALWNTVGGLREGLGTEAAIKQEVAITLIAVPLSFLIATNLWIWVALIGSLLFLLAVEFLNTAIERLCNHVQPELHAAIRVTKDLGSAAVFFAIALAALIWIAALLRTLRVLTAGSRDMAAPASNWQLRDSERVIKGNEALLGKKHLIVGMTRIRNEALILPDTLDYLATQVDAIVAYDDASTDETVDILRKHPKVALIVANQAWEKDVAARKLAEGRHRGLLLDMARSELPHDWMFCFDPDERVTGDLPSFVASLEADASDAVRVQLFDAYMTPEDCAPYAPDLPLLHFRKFYGPEQRDILMLWRNRPEIHFAEGHGRTPGGMERVKIDLHCQHYGKSLSVDHWEETCDYYIRHFPFETYGKKWTERKGQAIHTESDFKRPLYEWGETLFANAVRI